MNTGLCPKCGNFEHSMGVPCQPPIPLPNVTADDPLCGRVIRKPGRDMYVICERPSVDGGPCAYHRGVDRRAKERHEARMRLLADAAQRRVPRTLTADETCPTCGRAGDA